MSISSRKRFSVLHRDGFTCRYCGRRPPQVVLQVEHIVPRSKGGADEDDNLLAACIDCNRGKATDLIDGINGGVDPFQEVSIALARLLEASFPFYACEPNEGDVRERFLCAYTDAESVLICNSDLPPDDPAHDHVREYRDLVTKAEAGRV